MLSPLKVCPSITKTHLFFTNCFGSIHPIYRLFYPTHHNDAQATVDSNMSDTFLAQSSDNGLSPVVSSFFTRTSDHDLAIRGNHFQRSAPRNRRHTAHLVGHNFQCKQCIIQWFNFFIFNNSNNIIMFDQFLERFCLGGSVGHFGTQSTKAPQ